MRLTIIPNENLVSINGINYIIDIKNIYPNIHAVQWIDDTGWIEYINSPNETITDIFQFQLCIDQWNIENNKIKIEYINTKEDNKQLASILLSSTDWTMASDITNSTNSPYLTNQSEFIIYRNEIRKMAINPIEGNLIWAEIPKSVWTF